MAGKPVITVLHNGNIIAEGAKAKKAGTLTWAKFCITLAKSRKEGKITEEQEREIVHASLSMALEDGRPVPADDWLR